MPLTRLNRDGVLERSSTLLGALEPAQQHTVLPWDDPPFFANLQLKNKPTQGHFLRHMLVSIQVRTNLDFQADLPGCVLIPGQMFVTEDPDNTEVLPPSLPSNACSDVPTLTC